MKEVRQCSSCGGFCKKSGCERENVKPEPSKAELMAGISLQLREIERLRADNIALHEQVRVLREALLLCSMSGDGLTLAEETQIRAALEATK